MNTTWNKIEQWKKKALIALALVSAVNLSAQRPSQYQEVPVDQIGAVLAQRGNNNSATVVSQHPAYANRAAYRQTGQDIVVLDGERGVYDSYFSSGIKPQYHNSEQLSSVYRSLDREDGYILVYALPGNQFRCNHVTGDCLRQMWKYGNGFYAHPDGPAGHCGPGYGAPSSVRETIHGVADVIHGVGRIIRSQSPSRPGRGGR